MAMRLEKQNVNIILNKIISDMELWMMEGKEAEKSLCYIAGVIDMANAVISAIGELGGK